MLQNLSYAPRLANGRLVSAVHGCGRLWLWYNGCGAGGQLKVQSCRTLQSTPAERWAVSAPLWPLPAARWLPHHPSGERAGGRRSARRSLALPARRGQPDHGRTKARAAAGASHGRALPATAEAAPARETGGEAE